MNGINNILDAGISGSSIGKDFLHRMQQRERARTLNQYANSDVVSRPSIFDIPKKKEPEYTPKKHIDYSAKKHSTQILQAKKSVNAKVAATKIKLALRSLYAKRHNDNYDQEELETDIAHAESMERIAKKKTVNLRNEELAERNLKLKGIGGTPFEEKLAEEFEKAADPLRTGGYDAFEDQYADMTEDMLEAINDNFAEEYGLSDIISEPMYADMIDFVASEYGDFGSFTSDIFGSAFPDIMMDEVYDVSDMGYSDDALAALSEDMTEAIGDMLEDETIDEMFDELGDFTVSVNSEEDLEEMKRKHRIKEWKELMKADTKYFKSTMERLERNASKGMDMSSFSPSAPSYGATGVSISTPTVPSGVAVDVAV